MLKRLLSLVWLIGVMSSCETVDDDRIPYAPVSVSFATIGEWQIYGVTAALESRRFIKSEREPANFPYTDYSQTGFGGVLLVGDFEGSPRAYDLACPVERQQGVRIYVNSQEMVGECPKCHSTYDIFRFGGPLSGEAAEKGYGLRRYSVLSGSGVYMRITN